MSATTPSVQTTLRIPGNWAHPGELQERLPAGCRLTPEALLLPEGTEIECVPMPPDDQFPEVFASSCRQPASDDELAIVGSYNVNVGLSGPGGSLESARIMMRAGAVIVQAGGAGVFIDNSGVAHGAGLWQEMADDGSPDALSYAFVGVVGGSRDVWTMGMHVLGFPDVVMRRADINPDADTVVEIVRYICSSDKPVGDGHVFADETGPLFRATATAGDERFVGTPMHNPFGRMKLESFKEIAEGN